MKIKTNFPCRNAGIQQRSTVGILCTVLITVFMAAGCEPVPDTPQPPPDPEQSFPAAIACSDYSLTGCDWNWNSMTPDTVYLVNSQEELLTFISCKGNDMPEPAVDFDRYSLILAQGWTGSGIVDSLAKSMQQLSTNEYELKVEIELCTTSVSERWFIAVLVPKLPQDAVLSLSFSCGKDKESEPQEIPFTEYSLGDSGCGWANLVHDTLYVINSSAELANHISCENDLPQIDFSRQTLLTVSGVSSTGIIDVTAELSKTGTGYLLTVDVSQNIATVVQPWGFTLLADKLTTNHIELLVKYSLLK